MPGWHARTRRWVEDGKLVLLGVTQEQHGDRCRLFAQWQQFDWPILHDPINILRSQAVPIVVAIDEHGVVRAVGPEPETFEAQFIGREFPAPERPVELAAAPTPPPDGLKRLRAEAQASRTGDAWRQLGDALVLWGGEGRDEAIFAYQSALEATASDAPLYGDTHFRLGVAYRLRYDSQHRQPGDFAAAVRHWSEALDQDPNQYIWRRRIQQYGPRLDKPYPFYDWVEQAKAEVRERGEQPVRLRAQPSGAEIAQPVRRFTASQAPTTNPDSEGRITRDAEQLVQIDVTVVPPRIEPGASARVHVVLRPDVSKQAYWNNEVEPLRIWIDAPNSWGLEQRELAAAPVREAETQETRHLEFELQAPADAEGPTNLSGYALYYVCEQAGGTCLYRRQDFSIPLHVGQ